MINIEVDDRYLKDFIRFGKTKGKRVFYSKVIPELIFEKIIKISPEKTGLFKSGWRMVDQGKGAIAFTNSTDYAQIIDEGRYRGIGPRTVRGRGGGIFSKQAPEGITYPIVKEFGKDRLAPAMRKRISSLLNRTLRRWGFTSDK